VSMTNSTDRVEIITSVQRRRRWTAPEKVRMVEETFEPGMTVSLVARRHGVAPNQLFTWLSAGGARQPDRGRQAAAVICALMTVRLPQKLLAIVVRSDA
jgi:transposase-like protein